MVVALSLYGTNANATTVTTAGLLVSVTGAGGNGQATTKCGTSTGFSEIFAQGTTNAWAGAASIGAPGPNGWLFDVTTLEAQLLIAGTFTPKTRAKISVGSATADMYALVFKRNSAGVYTLIGTCSLLAQALGTSILNYNFAGNALPATAFAVGDKLGYNVWYNITANNSGSAAATIAFTNSNSATQGRASNAELDTPGYVPIVTPGGGLYRGRNRDRRD